ncbi:MAG: hypothetical protein J6D21_08560 [Clostridia bacterium]|nr:hypothetical protein [Clostridia bacterium]
MKIDKKTIDLLLAMDDDRLWQTICAVAAASGVKGIAAMQRPKDLSRLRAILSSMTEADLTRALELIGGKGRAGG